MRATFIYDTLQTLRTQLEKKYASSIALFYGKPVEVFDQILPSYPVVAVFTNHDYETYVGERGEVIRK
ncbi:deoxyribodipyrimidine photo-lyase [Nitrosomonas supralitoralis]|uniref:deoxyribodipyrimidine photo-lyase n=1 Tax=Nitrosomonas supralitoralis TaxID=2116706 RepID=UPI0018D4FEC7|nr:deoxyribodipyrimidine photo-lyase [Nitrosomonas supralitoralis]